MKQYIVKKGKHHCFHGQSIHWDKEEMIISFSLPPESTYKLDNKEDQEDINKIGGIVFGLGGLIKNQHGITTIENIHQNSIRLGMHDDEGKIKVFVYWYNKGIRHYYHINHTLYDLFNSYAFALDRVNNAVKVRNRLTGDSFTFQYDFKDVPTWGFYCYPFFGGNQVSPIDWKVLLKII